MMYAEELGHYWQTSQRSADAWLEDAKKLIKQVGGIVSEEMVGTIGGKSAIMLGFQHAGQPYRIVYNVLPSRTKNETAAKRQAATMLFHEVKLLVVLAKVQGVHGAFARHLLLPSGHSVWQAASKEISSTIPSMFMLPERAGS